MNTKYIINENGQIVRKVLLNEVPSHAPVPSTVRGAIYGGGTPLDNSHDAIDGLTVPHEDDFQEPNLDVYEYEVDEATESLKSRRCPICLGDGCYACHRTGLAPDFIDKANKEESELPYKRNKKDKVSRENELDAIARDLNEIRKISENIEEENIEALTEDECVQTEVKKKDPQPSDAVEDMEAKGTIGSLTSFAKKNDGYDYKNMRIKKAFINDCASGEYGEKYRRKAQWAKNMQK